MSYEILVGLKVTNNEIYQAYREAMAPILNQYGGHFCYDFHVSEVLKAEQGEDINRVFTLNFPSEAQQTRFFQDEGYLKVKAQYFDLSVAGVHILAAFNKE